MVRVVGLVGTDGSVNTTTSLGSAFSGSNVRSVASVDGTSFYVAGNSSPNTFPAGVEYVALSGFNPTQLITTPNNVRVVNIADGNLYITTGSSPYVGVSSVGTGLPTTSGQSAMLLPGAPGNTGSLPSPYGFYFADLSTAVAGIDVVYVADDRTTTGGGVQKWSLVSGSWVLNGIIASPTGVAVRSLDGNTSGTAVSLVATSANGLFVLTDNTGYNVAPTLTTLPGAIVTPGGSMAFRGVAFAPTTPAPTITSFTPTSGLANGSVTVTITGTDFTGATAVTLNGVSITPFTVVNGTTITFTVPTGATSGLLAVTTAGGTATSTGSFTVIAPNPMPAITSVSPNTAVAGSPSIALTVTGTGYVSGSVVYFNGTALTTTYVSATSLTATIPASALTTAGTYNVTVTSPTPGGGTSAAATFTVTTPAPTITSFTPTSGLADGTVTVTITGTNFTGATAVTLNGVSITPFTVVNSTTITFTVPTGATSGPLAVTTAGGTATSTGSFTVIAPNPAPTITSISPNTAVAGSGALPLTVTGTGFVSGSVVYFNGVALTTTYVSATSLTATIPASALATAGTYNVTVTSPTPGGGTSAAATFTVTTPAPTITSFTPTSGLANGTVTVTITGTNLTGATAVTLNGVAITPFTVVNSTTITFTVPTGATSGPLAVTTAGGTATSTGSFTVIAPNPAPTITSISPNTAVAGSGALPLTVTGTGFVSGTVITFNGTVLTTTYVSATSLTATIPASALATAGTYNVTVTSPTPGGGTSAAATFTVTTPAPTITSFTPTTGGPGTIVTITGTNLTGATSVRIGSFNVPIFTVVNGTTITFTVPNGTGSVNGLISVTTPGGTATSTTTFNLVSATLAAQALPGLTVFPNPATDRLTIVLPTAAPATVALRDLNGRLVLAPATLGADNQLLLPASLASGVYLLEVRQGVTLAIRRIEKN